MSQQGISRGAALAGIGAVAALAAQPAAAAPAARADVGPALRQVVAYDTFRPVVSVTFVSETIATTVQVTDSQSPAARLFAAGGRVGSAFPFPANSRTGPAGPGAPPRTVTLTATAAGQPAVIEPLGAVAAGYIFGVNPRRPAPPSAIQPAPYDAYVLIVAGEG